MKYHFVLSSISSLQPHASLAHPIPNFGVWETIAFGFDYINIGFFDFGTEGGNLFRVVVHPRPPISEGSMLVRDRTNRVRYLWLWMH